MRARPLLELDRFGLMGYDEAAYFVGGRALTLGYFPYRDFVHIQPPGILLFLAPFAVVGTWGFTAAKVAVVAIGAVSTGLLWQIARPRYGPIGALTAALVYALFRPSINAHQYLLIEPLTTVALLAAVAVYLANPATPTSGGRCTLVGGLLAVALACKFFAAVAIAALGFAVLMDRGRRSDLRRVALGFGFGCAALLGPFVLVAPGSFIRLTVSAQTGRPRSTRLVNRLLQTYWYAGQEPHRLHC